MKTLTKVLQVGYPDGTHTRKKFLYGSNITAWLCDKCCVHDELNLVLSPLIGGMSSIMTVKSHEWDEESVYKFLTQFDGGYTMIFAKLQAILDKDYDHETPDTPRSKEFCRAIKAWVKAAIEPLGGKIVGNVTGWKEAGGYIVWNDGLCTEFNIQFNSDEFLIRACEYPRNGRKGDNYWAKFHEFAERSRAITKAGVVWHR